MENEKRNEDREWGDLSKKITFPVKTKEEKEKELEENLESLRELLEGYYPDNPEKVEKFLSKKREMALEQIRIMELVNAEFDNEG